MLLHFLCLCFAWCSWLILFICSFCFALIPHLDSVAWCIFICLENSWPSSQTCCLFILFMEFLRQEYWYGLPFPPLVDHVLSELFIMIHLFWVALHSVVLSFPELHRPLLHKTVIQGDQTRNQPWIFIGRTGAEAPILWPPDAKNQLIRKDHDAGKDWRQKEKGVAEDAMVIWHHQLNGHEFARTPGDSEGWEPGSH